MKGALPALAIAPLGLGLSLHPLQLCLYSPELHKYRFSWTDPLSGCLPRRPMQKARDQDNRTPGHSLGIIAENKHRLL